jgi:hypothetical protein
MGWIIGLIIRALIAAAIIRRRRCSAVAVLCCDLMKGYASRVRVEGPPPCVMIGEVVVVVVRHYRPPRSRLMARRRTDSGRCLIFSLLSNFPIYKISF